MAARTKATASEPEATASTAGVLRPDEFGRAIDLKRFPAAAEVARWVENHWALRWDLPEGESFATQVLPHPTCSLTVELGSHRRAGRIPGDAVTVTGVVTTRFDVETRGSGRVVGVKFRPGGLAALTGLPASVWTDRVVPAVDVLDGELSAALADPDLVADPTAWVRRAEAGLAALPRSADRRYDQLIAIVADMLDDGSLLTVAEVAARHGVTTRTLQRLFHDYVGVGPKWVLDRYRMHDLVTELDEGYDGTMTDLAHRYGWYDQSHFTRDFTALIGVPPLKYRDRPDT